MAGAAVIKTSKQAIKANRLAVGGGIESLPFPDSGPSQRASGTYRIPDGLDLEGEEKAE
jgi:hypothetical protein